MAKRENTLIVIAGRYFANLFPPTIFSIGKDGTGARKYSLWNHRRNAIQPQFYESWPIMIWDRPFFYIHYRSPPSLLFTEQNLFWPIRHARHTELGSALCFFPPISGQTGQRERRDKFRIHFLYSKSTVLCLFNINHYPPLR